MAYINPIYGQFPVPNPTDLTAKEISLQGIKPVDRLIVGNMATSNNQPHSYKETQHLLIQEFNHKWSLPRYDPSLNQSVIVPNLNGFHFFN